MADFLAALAKHTDELADLARHVATAGAPDERFVAADPTGAVQVTVTGEGRPSDVEVHQRWRERIEAADLGTAVQAAVQAAGLARLDAWAEDARDALSDPVSPATAPSPAPDGSRIRPGVAAPGRLDGDRREQALGEILSMLEEVGRQLDRCSAELREPTQAFTAYSSARHVSATVDDSGEVTGIAYDGRWLADAQAHAIGRETGQALRAAGLVAAERGALARLEAGPLGSLRRLATEPEQRVRRPR
jgi:hypothetical protein